VFHSGIPITLVPLDATNTIPITEQFLAEFKERQNTFEAQYCYQALKLHNVNSSIASTCIGIYHIFLILFFILCNRFFNMSQPSFMWDSFATGVAISIMSNGDKYDGENEFSVMEYMNLTVVTSNKPYDANDGSNPFFNGQVVPKFNLTEYGVHSGHVQTRVDDPFCLINGSNRGRCEVLLNLPYSTLKFSFNNLIIFAFHLM
jgi:hypothetical protein